MQNTWWVNMHTHCQQLQLHTTIHTCNASVVLCVIACSCTCAYVTHPPSFTLVFNRLLSVWYCPLHIVYWVLHIVLYAVYHFPLGDVSCRGGTQEVGTRCGGRRRSRRWIQMERRWGEGGGIMGEWEGGRRGSRERRRKEEIKKREIMSQLHLASHPFASLFELFAFWEVVLSLLHIVLSLQHPPLNVVHQTTLHEKK